ncbi:cytochrome c oxidase assembly protein [Polyangium spumosum]|uniref:cytochrome c oxidase assembly protein n=1 Tax=Polyangium spumosum TaxID=889282 RepID=UPI00129A5818
MSRWNGASPGARFFDEPLLAATLALVAAWYLLGLRVLLRRVGLGRRSLLLRAWFFLGGLVTTTAALCSPLDGLAEELFSAHMAQHLLLVSVAAPLFALSAPRAVLAWALPGPARGRLGRIRRSRPLRAILGVLGRPVTVFLLHSVAVWAWHVPSLYGAALRSGLLHALEHGTFLGTSIVFFGTLARAGAPGRIGHGAAILYAFVASLQCGALGALLASARVPFYPEHAEGAAAWGLGLLEDQQLAGVLMWVPGGAAYAIAALLLARAWLRAAASAPQWEVSCDR